MFSNQIMPELCSNYARTYYCKHCDYGTDKKSSFNNHNGSIKHLAMVSNRSISKLCSEFICVKCTKIYKDNSGLWRHKKKCTYVNNLNVIIKDHIEIHMEEYNDDHNDDHNEIHIEKRHNNANTSFTPNDKDDIIMMLLKQNSDLIKDHSDVKQIILEIVKNGITNNSHNNINSHNKAFNLNFFLNDTCKNAMNITEFVDSIKLELSDLMELGEIGYVAGMSKIITKNLNALDETIRPIHCTDTKRETFYVKDEDKWEKEDVETKKLKKLIFRLSNKTYKLMPKYREMYPDYDSSTSTHSDEYCKIIIEAMMCDPAKDDKIIRNISKITAITTK